MASPILCGQCQQSWVVETNSLIFTIISSGIVWSMTPIPHSGIGWCQWSTPPIVSAVSGLHPLTVAVEYIGWLALLGPIVISMVIEWSIPLLAMELGGWLPSFLWVELGGQSPWLNDVVVTQNSCTFSFFGAATTKMRKGTLPIGIWLLLASIHSGVVGYLTTPLFSRSGLGACGQH